VRFRFIFILLLFGLGIQLLPAQNVPHLWPSAVAIRQGLNIEWFRTAAAGPDGSMIIVWSDTRFGGRDMWAQKVNAAGVFQWGSPALLIDNKFDRQEDPVIIATTDNGYVIAWIDFSTDPDGNVFAQKVSNNGQILWQQGGVPVCTVAGNQISINGCADDAGGAYLNWIDSRNPSKDLYGAHVTADGSMPWNVNLPFANSTGDESSNTMWEDGNGGFIIAYTNRIEHQSDLYMNRFLANGTSAWGGPQVLSGGPNDQDQVKVAPDGTGSFIFAWKDMRLADPQIYAQRVNLSGQFLWPEPINVYPEPDTAVANQSNQSNPRVLQSSDTGAIIVWEDNRNDNVYTDLYAQKLSTGGALLWTVSGVAVSVAPFYQKDPRLIDDANGGCVVVWDDTRDGNYPNVDVYAQHILANGTMSWEPNGRVICNAPGEQSGSLIKKSDNNLFICWGDFRNGSGGLYYQVLNTSGTAQLEPNGKLVIWGLSGDAVKDQYVVLKRSNDVVVVWQDTRFANFGYQIFFQIIQPDSTVLMPVNGKPITTFTGGNQENPSAVVTPDGKIAITWNEQRGEYPKVYTQLLDVDGEYLWGNTGKEVTLATPIEQSNPKISYDNGSFYIGWSNSDSLSADLRLFRIWGQKMDINGNKFWGDNGKLISATQAGHNPTECLMQRLVGRYFVWLSQDKLYAKLVDATTGDALPGWNANGNRSSKYTGDDLLQLSPIAAADGDGLVVVWEDLRVDFIKNLFAQKYNSNGTLAWDSLGVVVGDYGREQDQASLYIADGAYIPWRENIDGFTQDIAMQKISMTGQPMWGQQGTFVIQRPDTQSAPSVAQIDSNNLLVSWEDTFNLETDILMRRMGLDGTGYDNALGYYVNNAPKSQFHPTNISMGNYKDFIVWEDARSSGKTEIDGLYIQYVDYYPVGNNDLVVPTPVAVLYDNYPNPFNPETTISFSIAYSGKAKLEVFNIRGQKVRTLLDGDVDAGMHKIVWNGTNDNNKTVGSGVYFYKLSCGHLSKTKKMILIK
jgi:hypothetical protein